jgi:hypothetical protein
MKSVKLALIIVLFCCIGFIACKNEAPKDLIVKKWKLIEFIPNPEWQITDSFKKKYENSLSIEFTSDNKYVQTAMGKTQTGTYNISEDGKMIRYKTNPAQETFVDTVVELTTTKLSVIEQTGSKKIFRN